jgi:hypothetical protein
MRVVAGAILVLSAVVQRASVLISQAILEGRPKQVWELSIYEESSAIGLCCFLVGIGLIGVEGWFWISERRRHSSPEAN